jgi:general secretion pathway protein N
MSIESLPPLRLRRQVGSDERAGFGWHLLWCSVALLAVGVTVVAQYPAAWAAERVAAATGHRVLLADSQGSIWHGSATLALTATAAPMRRCCPAGCRGRLTCCRC